MLAGVLCVGAIGAADAPPRGAEDDLSLREQRSNDEIDADAFFTALAERYRSLTAYRDTVEVVQVTRREGEEPHRVETRIACVIEDGTLRVETPGSQVREAMRLDVPVRMSPAMQALQLRYNLWLAPHLVLRFTDKPLAEFRLGVEKGFKVIGAEPVVVRDRQLVHLTLQSAETDGEAKAVSRFDLFIDSALMLMVRVEGRQRLPDGADYHTMLDITPEYAEIAEPRDPDGPADADEG